MVIQSVSSTNPGTQNTLINQSEPDDNCTFWAPHSSSSWPSSLQLEWCNGDGALPRNSFSIINIDFQLLKMSIVTFILIYVPSEIRDQSWPVGFYFRIQFKLQIYQTWPGNLWRDGNKLYLCLIWVHKATNLTKTPFLAPSTVWDLSLDSLAAACSGLLLWLPTGT